MPANTASTIIPALRYRKAHVPMVTNWPAFVHIKT